MLPDQNAQLKGFISEWSELLIKTHLLEVNKQEIIEIHSWLLTEGLEGHFGLIFLYLRLFILLKISNPNSVIKCNTHLHYSL